MKSPHKSEVEMASPIATADNETKLHSDGGPSDKSSKNSKPAVRTGELENEQHVIPQNRLIVVFIGLMLATFLAALDQTIVCKHTFLFASKQTNDIKQLRCLRLYMIWVEEVIIHGLGLAMSLLQLPSHHFMDEQRSLSSILDLTVSDLIGRKPILFGTIVLFLIGSALCGAAQCKNTCL